MANDSNGTSDAGRGDLTDEFRCRLQRFLADHHPGPRPKGRAEATAWQKAWSATLVDHGCAGPSWPEAYGGMDLPFALQVVYAEEMGRAHVPGPPGTGVGIAGPTIIRYATEDQKTRWLPPMLRADEVWAQGYSEPDAGSDLPSLRTSAVRRGDVYVLNGEKVWSSVADIADVLFCLVRTGPGEREKGISYLLVEARSPGIEIRPIRDLTGGADFCSITFTDVEVPVAHRVGAEGGGWPIARTSLGHERAAGVLNQATAYRRIVSELMSLARENGARDDPLIRQRLASAYTDMHLMHVAGVRSIQDILARGEPGPASSTSRILAAEFEQRLHILALDVIGAAGMLDRRDPHAVQRGRWVWGFLRTRASTIGTGTSEIQRNTVAERVLGLPREP